MYPSSADGSSGCATCRAARIKCDEGKPQCETCRHRKVICGGYVQNLKWIDQNYEPGRRSHQRQESGFISPKSTPSCNTKVSSSVARNPRLGPALQSQADFYILEYWDRYMPRLSLVNPGVHFQIQGCQRALLWDSESILLPAILAHGASHLAARQLLSQVEALHRKQVALETMTRSLPKLLGRQSGLSLSFVSTSMTLSAIELSRGGDAQAIVPHIRATFSHVVSSLEIDGQPSAKEGQDELLKMRITQMCYFDTMCCVPCARRPVVPRTFWNDFVLPFLETGLSKSQPDLFFGFGFRIFPLIGEAAALAEDLFESQVASGQFMISQDKILSDLECAMDRIPAMVECPCPDEATEDSIQLQNHNGCVLAARAHAVATQIFLMRADPAGIACMKEKIGIALQVNQLRDLVYSILPSLNAATMMLWPLFVLGCETPVGTQRCVFEEHVDSMLAERWFLNIASTIDALREVVWKLGSSEQENWAWHCWRARISLCLA